MLLKYLTHPSLVFFVLPWIMALLVAGTVVQPAMGIYQAQKFFFEGFVFWLGPVPLPGMFSLLVLLATSLSAKILFTSTFSWPHSGTWLIHAGALLLLVGGLVTSLTQQEGSMLLAPEETKNIFDDYYDKELVINKNGDDVVRIAFARAAAMKGDDFRALVPFDMSVTKACHNCDVVQDQNNTVRLVARPHEKDAEKNLAGVQLRVQGRDMLVVQGMPAHVSAYQHGDDIYHVSIHRKKHALPFSIRLLSFSPSFHPGTHVAREYASVIEVADGALTWQTAIRMNEPLRYKGYTVYQASFVEGDGPSSSVLTIVKNEGRVLPYVATGVMLIGFVLHLWMRRRGRA